MELVYPIYLDTPMMTAFLASLKGGLLEKTDVESKALNSKQKSAKASAGLKLSNLVSTFLDANAQGEITRGSTENLESQYKGTITFPEATLFIELRDILFQQKVLKKVETAKDLKGLQLGDIVEIQGFTKPNPSFELRSAISQLIPLIKPFLNVRKLELEGQLFSYEQYKIKVKGIEKIKIGDEEFDYKPLASNLQNQIRNLEQQSSAMGEMIQIVENLFPQEVTSSLIMESSDFLSVCKIFTAFVRNEQVQELYDANWRCIGKVIGVLEKDEEHNLFKRLPIGLFAKQVFSEMVTSLQNEQVNVKVSEPVIEGPGLVIAVLAIFT